MYYLVLPLTKPVTCINKYSTEVHTRDNYSLPDSPMPRIVLKYVVTQVDGWTPWVGSPEASGKDQTTLNPSPESCTGVSCVN